MRLFCKLTPIHPIYVNGINQWYLDNYMQEGPFIEKTKFNISKYPNLGKDKNRISCLNVFQFFFFVFFFLNKLTIYCIITLEVEVAGDSKWLICIIGHFDIFDTIPQFIKSKKALSVLTTLIYLSCSPSHPSSAKDWNLPIFFIHLSLFCWWIKRTIL